MSYKVKALTMLTNTFAKEAKVKALRSRKNSPKLERAYERTHPDLDEQTHGERIFLNSVLHISSLSNICPDINYLKGISMKMIKFFET